jgi:hypothetical protein
MLPFGSLVVVTVSAFGVSGLVIVFLFNNAGGISQCNSGRNTLQVDNQEYGLLIGKINASVQEGTGLSIFKLPWDAPPTTTLNELWDVRPVVILSCYSPEARSAGTFS